MNEIIEIRLRINQPIILTLLDGKRYLSLSGQSILRKSALMCDKKLIDEVILNLTERSIYAFSDQIKNGFITSDKGIRVGLVGECIFDCEKIISVRNVTSLNVRIPHDIKGCSNEIYKIVMSDKVYNTLIISRPLRGKTTIIKDLIRNFNQSKNFNLLVIDERGELSDVSGENVDVIKYSNKSYAFNLGLRSMAPDLVFTDELLGEKDWKYAKKAIKHGVKIIATCHGENIEDVKDNCKGIFDRYVILEPYGNMGKIKNVFNGEFELI